MATRFRKSIKVAPGVRLNVSKKSVGLSAGTKGAHISVNSSGRVTKSVGIPGTGVSHVSSSTIGSGCHNGGKVHKKSMENNPIKGSLFDTLVPPGSIREKLMYVFVGALSFFTTLAVLFFLFVK